MKQKWMRICALLLAAVVLCCGLWGSRVSVAWAQEAMVQEGDFKTLKVGTGGQAVRQMQVVLQNLGFYEGSINGNFSRSFEGAVKDFQADFGIEETGEIDWELYALLYEEFSSFPAETEKPKATGKPNPTQKPKATKAPQATKKPGLFDFLFGDDEEEEILVEEDGQYTDKEHVAAYLREYEKLPSNYITKQEARKLGWNGSRSGLWDVAYGMSIGGDKFGNYEEILPTKRGRQYYECDIDFDGWKANAKRIVYSNDGLIFYTEDHYETFEEITEP